MMTYGIGPDQLGDRLRRSPRIGAIAFTARGRIAGPDQDETQDRRSDELGGTNGAGGAFISARVMPSSSGASRREVAEKAQHLRARRRVSRRSARRAPSGRPDGAGTPARWRSRSCRHRRAVPRRVPAPSRRRRACRSPSAVTRSTASRLSTVRPCLRIRWPRPPPSVRPPMPVWLMIPPVVASPNWLGGAVELAPEEPAGGAGGPRGRIDPDRFHQREVDHHPAVADRVTGDGVPATADRDQHVPFARKADGLDDVVCAGTAGDQRRSPVDRAVPDPAGLVVSFLARPQQRAPEPSAQAFDQSHGDLRGRRAGHRFSSDGHCVPPCAHIARERSVSSKRHHQQGSDVRPIGNIGEGST